MADKVVLKWADEGADDHIRYNFTFEDGRIFEFIISPSRNVEYYDSPELNDWTLLDNNKCTNCTLKSDTINRCPAAVDLSELIKLFDDVRSYEPVNVVVTCPQRTISKDCDIQSGLQSFIGLIMATSGCPILAKFKPMAIHHLPFSSTEETLYRTCGNYLIDQFFKKRNGQEHDFELNGLTEFYKDIQNLNTCFVKRLSGTMRKDANVNAIIRLFSMSALVQFALDDGLDSLEDIFK